MRRTGPYKLNVHDQSNKTVFLTWVDKRSLCWKPLQDVSVSDPADRKIIACVSSCLKLPTETIRSLTQCMDVLARRQGIERKRAEDSSPGGAHIVDLVDPGLEPCVTRSSVPSCGYWIPAEVDIGSRPVRFISDINGLDRSHDDNNALLYDLFASVFQAMLPHFEMLAPNLFDRGKSKAPLRVIVKAQNYEIPAGGALSQGPLHLEGLPEESIGLVGIYYYEVSSPRLMKNGELDLVVPIKLRCGNRTAETHRITVRQGQVIVFDNRQVYHRVADMSCPALITLNEDVPHQATRKILSFFVVDGVDKMETWVSSQTVAVNVRSRLHKAIVRRCPDLPLALHTVIVDYVVGTRLQSLQRREEARILRAKGGTIDAGGLIRTGYED